ncbi:MAG: HlyC/CorC family transporter [Erysipelotrichaceae bacterium]|nr:HlyC/CorC family transporter [Erysipelotrichaceae bacterium]
METAFASVSKSKIKALAEKGNTRAETALYVLDNFDRAITTILIGTNIVHIAAATVVTLNVTRLWGIGAVSISTIITTLAVFFFGEMLPKSIARKYSERFSLACAGPLKVLMVILKPVSSLLTMIGNFAASLSNNDGELSVTEDELYDIIEDLTEEGILDEDQGDLISSALQFREVTAESILTSRIDVAAIDIEMTPEEILTIIKAANHSRLPVYQDTIDHIVGILHIRKYMKAYLSGKDMQDITPMLDEPLFIHQSAKIDDLLKMMSAKKTNVAIVTDNYGGTLGVVSVEDILEELVGEIWDEDDKAVENITKIADNVYSVSADELFINVLDELDIDYSEETGEELENKLISEICYENFTKIPQEGDHFKYLNTEIEIETMQQNRIVRVKLTVLPEEKGEQA